MLFSLLVLLGFCAMLASKFPPTRIPEWVAWALWTVAAFIYFLPQIQ